MSPPLIAASLPATAHLHPSLTGTDKDSLVSRHGYQPCAQLLAATERADPADHIAGCPFGSGGGIGPSPPSWPPNAAASFLRSRRAVTEMTHRTMLLAVYLRNEGS